MKIFRDFSIKNKLVVLVLGVALLAIVTGSAFVIYNNIETFTEDLISDTDTISQFLAEALQAPLSFNMEEEVEEELKGINRIPYVENVYVFDENDDIYGQYDKKSNVQFVPPVPEKELYKDFREDNFLHLFRPLTSLEGGERIGTLYIRATRAQLDEKINAYIRSMVIGLAILLVLTYLLALRFQRIISHPILTLAKVTGEITEESDYSVRVTKEGNDEIGLLYQAFNNMLEQIQVREKQRDEAMSEQQRLLAELEEKNKELEQVVYVTSHDLRSPLVNIQGFSKELDFSIKELTVLLNSEEIPAELKEKFTFIIEEDIPDSLKYILSSTSKMDSLLSGLLKLSRVGRTATTFGNIDMDELVTEISNAFEFHFKEGHVDFSVDSLPDCYGNDVQLNQLFSNLVGNALKYRDPDRVCKIHFSGYKEDDRVIYTVEDTGQGIAKEHQKKIFEIFHRLNPNDTLGEGLGLTIVNKIVGRHNGKIWVESEAGVGSKFFVSLLPPREHLDSTQKINNTSKKK